MDHCNFLTFHRDEDRHLSYAAPGRRSAFFDQRTRMWIVSDPADCRKLIASERLRTVPYGADYQTLEQRFGIDFSAMRFAFDHIPLCLHGEHHARIRKAGSEFLAARRADVAAQLPGLIARHASVLDRDGRIELMKELVEPLVHEFTCLIAGLDGSRLKQYSRTSQIFDRSSGLPKRQAIEAEVAALHRAIADQVGAEGGEFDVGLRLAFFILGNDPLRGTLGESLRRLFADSQSLRLTEMDFPPLPPETGVPFIERLVIEPFELDGHLLQAGDRVRLFLQAFACEPIQTRTNFFGAGLHACIGRPLSIELWKGLTACLSTLPIRVALVWSMPRTTDYVFTCPERLIVEVSR